MTVTEIVAIASVVIALVSLIITVVRLFNKLTVTAAELRLSTQKLTEAINDINGWKRDVDDKLGKHETRISILEHEGGIRA